MAFPLLSGVAPGFAGRSADDGECPPFSTAQLTRGPPVCRPPHAREPSARAPPPSLHGRLASESKYLDSALVQDNSSYASEAGAGVTLLIGINLVECAIIGADTRVNQGPTRWEDGNQKVTMIPTGLIAGCWLIGGTRRCPC